MVCLVVASVGWSDANTQRRGFSMKRLLWLCGSLALGACGVNVEQVCQDACGKFKDCSSLTSAEETECVAGCTAYLRKESTDCKNAAASATTCWADIACDDQTTCKGRFDDTDTACKGGFNGLFTVPQFPNYACGDGPGTTLYAGEVCNG